MQWQPIETAPRDDSRILVVWYGLVEIATWNTAQQNWQEWPDGDFDNGGEVTLWMPLPDPSELQRDATVSAPMAAAVLDTISDLIAEARAAGDPQKSGHDNP